MRYRSAREQFLTSLLWLQVLERTSVIMNNDQVEARFTVALPAAGRSILGQKANQILTEALPGIVKAALGT